MMKLPIIKVNNIVDTHRDRRWVEHFTSLNEVSIKTLVDANLYYEEIPNVFLNLSGKSLALHRDNLVAAVKDVDSSRFHDNMSSYQKDIYRKRMSEWYFKQHNSMKKENFWIQLATQCRDKSQFDELKYLKDNWMKQADLSFYTSQALIEVARSYIPVFISYMNLLSLELKACEHKLPWVVKKQLYHYIGLLRQAVVTGQQRIVQAMLSRLQTASGAKDIFFDDVTLACAAKLKEMMLLKESYTLAPHGRCDLNETAHDYFHHYIVSNGTAQQKRLLDGLCWHRTDDHYLVIRKAAERIVVPKALETFVLAPSFMQRLFGVDKNNKAFFSKRFHLINRLRFLPKPKTDFGCLFTFHDNEKLRELFSLSQHAYAECESAEEEKPTSFWGKLFYQDRERLMTSWQEYLCKQQNLILEGVLKYASFIADQLNTRIALDLDIEVLCAKHFQANIRQFNDEIILIISRSELKAEDHPEYLKFSAQYEQLLSLPQRLERKKNQMQEDRTQASFAVESSQQIDAITSQHEYSASSVDGATKHYLEDESNPFGPISIEYPKAELIILLQGLLSPQGKLIHNNCQFEGLVGQVEEFIQSFNFATFNNCEREGSLIDTINQLFKAYLEVWQAAEEKCKQTLGSTLSGFESLLNLIALESIKESITELVEVRENECWYAFQAKCYGLRVSYGFKDDDGRGYEECTSKAIDVKQIPISLYEGSANTEITGRSTTFFKKNKTPHTEDVQQPNTLSY